MPLAEGVHSELLSEAIAADGRGQCALLGGEPAIGAFQTAAALHGSRQQATATSSQPA